MGVSTTVTNAEDPKPLFQLPDIIGLGGAVSGFFGGIAAMITGALMSLVTRGDLWAQAKQISAVVLGPGAASQPGFVAGPVIVGTLLHLVVSLVLGALFSIVKRRILGLPSDMGMPVLLGLIYGLLVWLLAYYIILPTVNPVLLNTYQPSFIIQNIVYGIVTGLFYAAVRPDPYHE